MVFSLDNARGAVAHLHWLADEGRYLLARDVYECARTYERNAGKKRTRPAIIRRALKDILRVARQSPTPKRKERLRKMLREFPSDAYMYIHAAALANEEPTWSASPSIYLTAGGDFSNWKDFLTTLEIEKSSCDDRAAFGQVAGLAKEAFKALSAFHGGQRARDTAASALFFGLRFLYERTTRLKATHGYREDLSDPWPAPFSKIAFSVGGRVEPALSVSKIDDYVKDALAYGDPDIR